MVEHQILAYLEKHEAEIWKDLKELVLAEASTDDIKELAECRDLLCRIITDRTGIKPVVHKTAGGHDVIQFEYGSGEEKIILIGHYDTVHPVGSFHYREEGNEIYGPGIYDMKNGLISCIWCVKAYQELKLSLNSHLVFLFNGDEETGSKESEPFIRSLAAGAKAALITEPSNSDGDLKTGRKGGRGYTIRIQGRASHSGSAPQNGINAIEEMAREIIYIQGLTNYETGTTVNVGVAQGGTKANVVPAEAEFEVNCRFVTMEEAEKLHNTIINLPTSVPGAVRTVETHDVKPPMEQTEANIALFRIAEKCGKELGLSFTHRLVGGGSDGNTVASMGIPTLDGLGGHGKDSHSERERLLADEYLPRIAMLASLILKI